VLAGKTAPDFELKATDGKTYSLTEALKNGPVVLAFYKVSCPVCQYTFPFLERLHKTYSGSNVTFLAISQDDLRESRSFEREYGVSFPSLIDTRGYPVSNAYGLTTVPTVLLIEPDRKVSVSFTGFSRPDLQQIAAQLARGAGKSPAPLFLPHENVPDYKPG
jgi:peroxiredoxin